MNVARRDGMGTVMLEAAVTIGRAPDHYFQAVGSGTGGIAAWEASLRLKQDGRFLNGPLPNCICPRTCRLPRCSVPGTRIEGHRTIDRYARR